MNGARSFLDKGAAKTRIENVIFLLPNDFDTVSPYAQDAVKALFEKAILEGDENGNFRPHDLVTRAQAAKIMYCIKYGKGE